MRSIGLGSMLDGTCTGKTAEETLTSCFFALFSTLTARTSDGKHGVIQPYDIRQTRMPQLKTNFLINGQRAGGLPGPTPTTTHILPRVICVK